MKKRIYTIIVAVLALLCFCVHNESRGAREDSTEGTVPIQKQDDSSPEPRRMPNEDDKAPRVVGSQTELSLVSADPPELTIDQRKIAHPDFVWYTSPTTTGVIRNVRGEVLFEASKDVPFVQLKSRPGYSHIAVVSYNRKSFVIDIESREKTPLPEVPPVEGSKGFEVWEWIENRLILGLSYVTATDSIATSVACCSTHSIEETILFAFDCREKTIKKVILPDILRKTAFTLGVITADGSIEILAAENHAESGKRLGWFKVRN